MRQILFLTFIYSISSTYAQTFKTSRLAGIYSYGSSAQKGAVGQVIVYPESDTTILFYFESNIGPPSYSMGAIYGRVKIFADTGIFIKDSTSKCKSYFDFKKNKLILTADYGEIDCGFGHKVFMLGQFKKISSKLTNKFMDLDGNEYYFNNTRPEDYNKH